MALIVQTAALQWLATPNQFAGPVTLMVVAGLVGLIGIVLAERVRQTRSPGRISSRRWLAQALAAVAWPFWAFTALAQVSFGVAEVECPWQDLGDPVRVSGIVLPTLRTCVGAEGSAIVSDPVETVAMTLLALGILAISAVPAVADLRERQADTARRSAQS